MTEAKTTTTIYTTNGKRKCSYCLPQPLFDAVHAEARQTKRRQSHVIEDALKLYFGKDESFDTAA